MKRTSRCSERRLFRKDVCNYLFRKEDEDGMNTSSKDTPIIATELLKGQGLGNQLFCYVTTRALAFDKGYDFCILNRGILANNIHSNKKCLSILCILIWYMQIGYCGNETFFFFSFFSF